MIIKTYVCKKCGDLMQNIEAVKNSYFVSSDGMPSTFITTGSDAINYYECGSCGVHTKTFTLRALKRVAKLVTVDTSTLDKWSRELIESLERDSDNE